MNIDTNVKQESGFLAGPTVQSWQYEYNYTPTLDQPTKWGKAKQLISNFLYFCAGADQQILRICPHSERVKEQGIGGVVLATATLAFFSGSYAFYTVFSPKEGFALSNVQQETDSWAVLLAIVFGLCWSLMIFNLDRFIVSSGGHGDGTGKISLAAVGRAAPRLGMALIIGLVLSKPLEIRIMQTEIDAKLTQEQQNFAAELQKGDDVEYQRKRDELDEKKAAVVKKRDDKQAEIATLRDQIANQRNKVDAEADGSASGRPGEGKAFNAKKNNLEEMKIQYDATRRSNEPAIQSLEKEIAGIQSEIDTLVNNRSAVVEGNKKKAASQDGLIKRMQLAGAIAPVASWMLTALLIALEVAPIFFKMMVSIGPYDYLSENIKRVAIASRGIGLKERVDGKEGVEVKDAIYYEADTALEHEVGKFRVEQELSRVAYQEYQSRVAKDIRKNPDRYQRDVAAQVDTAA